MTTVINNGGKGEGSSEGVVSLVIGIVILTMVGVLFFVYVLPVLRNTEEPSENAAIDVNVTN